jgi:uncharacterized membrane protein YdjX (TVP38/TMEM64 family)
MIRKLHILFHLSALAVTLKLASAFVQPTSLTAQSSVTTPLVVTFSSRSQAEKEEEEEIRLNVLKARREQVRGVLKSAESLRNFRLQNGFVPQVDEETGKPISDSKLAVTLTAFVVAAGAIALRIGGRAALVSAVGLDFIVDSPEIKENLDSVLNVADSMDESTKILLFVAAWTAVKVLCFDAGGVVLALASGILFGGVIQGAVWSALSATIGSSVAFGLAKWETPVRQKALEVLEEYPSLRGIEKVVARDGFKAVLTLRLAPVLPIPIGLYNYIYGVTNVPLTDFCAGIFLGSLKPYLLDSYLGYFGKEVIQGTTDATGYQDFLLIGALGVSVLIGVFASQLAGKTWDSVLEEVEAEKKAKAENGQSEEDDDGIKREIFGWQVPEWIVGFQISLKAAEERINDFVLDEYEAKVWNYTKDDIIPVERDPAKLGDSPEVAGAYQGFDFAASVCDGLVLSPVLFTSFLKYADPLYNEAEDEILQNRPRDETLFIGETESTRKELLQRLDELKALTEQRIAELDAKINDAKVKY